MVLSFKQIYEEDKDKFNTLYHIRIYSVIFSFKYMFIVFSIGIYIEN
jgi:hypothetical protein